MDPLYDYVSEIANRMYPTWEFDDSCGEYYQTDSFRGWDFVHQLEDGRLKCPFTKEQYLENTPIIRSLRAMGIDTEKFWMAMLFVYDVVRERTENVQQVPTSVFEEFRTFAKYLQENPDAKIRAWRGREHGATLESDLAKRMLGKLLADNVAELYAKLSNTRSFGLDGFSVNLKSCYKITLAVKCFLPLLEKFKEEDNRSTNPNKVSYNRMLLISRIVYFFGYTDNPKFLDNDESISGIWTSYKDKEWTTIGANFR